MPESRKPNKSLKHLTIAAVVLLVIVLVPYAVIEKARWDAGQVVRGVRFEIADIHFTSDSFVLLTFEAPPDSPPHVQTVYWSLSQWRVTRTVAHPDAFAGIRWPSRSAPP